LVQVISTYRSAHAVSSNAGTVSANLINGFVGYTLEATEEKQKVNFHCQVYFDYLKKKFYVELKFSATDGFNAWHCAISKAFSSYQLQDENVEVFERKGIWLVRYSHDEVTAVVNNAPAFVSKAMEALVLLFANEAVNPLGFQYSHSQFTLNQSTVDSLLEAVSTKIEPLLSNKRRAERRIFQQLKYTDCVSMNENYKSQALRWGVDFSNNQLSPYVSIQLESDTSNVQLTQALKAHAQEKVKWKVLSANDFDATDLKEWKAWENEGAIVSASSSWNKKHGPEQGKLNLQEGLANWSAKANDSKQWIQVDFGEKKLIEKVFIQGRYNRAQWVTKFRIQVSPDGKKFEEIGAEYEGSVDQQTIVEVALSPRPVARFVRIVPVEWHEHISMRFDVHAKDFREQAFEMKLENFENGIEETELLSAEIAGVISEIQLAFPGKLGLVK
jgi:hypothetical protein